MKEKKPFFTKPWFIVLVVLIVIGATVSGGKKFLLHLFQLHLYRSHFRSFKNFTSVFT